jgi:hypothetical protein
MSMILRSWLAFTALGAGILHLALAPGSPPAIAVVLVPLGAAEFAWAVAVLARGRYVLAPLARAIALAPLVGWAALLLVGRAIGLDDPASSPTLIPMAVATLFNFAIAISLTVHLRSERTAEPAAAGQNPWAQLGGLFVGGLAVSLLMTPALSFTEAGLNNPHATHAPAGGTTDFGSADHSGH